MKLLKILTILIVTLQTRQVNCKKCGIPTKKDEAESESQYRVLGGTNAEKGVWPWVVEILELDTNTKTYYQCGGSLISSEWVLTSAFCIYYMEGSGINIFKYVVVALGYLHLDKIEEGSVISHVSKFIIHEGFRVDPHILNDIALLKLKTPIDLESNKDINTVCLPVQNSLWHSRYPCFLTGWGDTNTNKEDAMTLQQAELQLINQQECEAKYAEHSLRRINEDYFCAGEEEKGACKGNAGAPFVCYSEDKKAWDILGVTSIGDGDCHEPDYPTILVRVDSYLDWITTTIRNFNCGIQLIEDETAAPSQFKVFGGAEARKGAWPWAVEIQEEYEGQIINRCGGALINTEWVLTNANCIVIISTSGKDIVKTVFVALGYLNLDKKEEGSFRIGISKVVIHNEFNIDPPIAHDIALVKLQRPIEAADSLLINPICLPDKDADYSKAMCFMVGWGYLNANQDKTSILQEAVLRYIDQEECKNYYAGHLQREITDYYFCAGSTEEGFCGGDQGTPFACNIGDIWYLVGLTSGSGGKTCAEPNNPSIFLRIQSYLDWISEVIDKNSCGTQILEPLPPEEYRIKGGSDAERGFWPWAVALQAVVKTGLFTFCSGVLIQSEWVLTAGHCMTVMENKINLHTELLIAIGYSNLEEDQETAIRVGVKKVVMHKEYQNFPNIIHDIALLKLKHAVDYTDNNFIKPACLADVDIDYITSPCFVSGWGLKEEDYQSPILQQAKLSLLTESNCIQFIERLQDKNATVKWGRTKKLDVICAAELGVSLCWADSGSPLVCLVDDKWHLIGIASGGHGDCTTESTVTIFKSVTNYLNWILSGMEE